MPFDQGLNSDLQFLILEVKKQGRASWSVIENPTPKKVAKIKSREFFIDNLKNTIEHKSYFNIHRQEEGEINHFKAIITIASNLERCADFFESIGTQMSHVHDHTIYVEFDLKRYYQIIDKALDAIYPAVTQQNLELAQKICDYEQVLDDYYAETAALIRKKLRQRGKVDDLLTLLAIAQYLERVGDSFLNIGEAILDIYVGEKMGIQQFRELKKGLESQGIDISDDDLEFKPIMNTRSGCRVARIVAGPAGASSRSIFYKEGAVSKIDEEVVGLKLWQRRYPGRTPKILWYNSRKDNATLLLEYIDGQDLLEILINKSGKLEQALELLTRSLTLAWDANYRDKSRKSDYMAQLLSRKSDITSVHSGLFESEFGLDKLIVGARRIERDLRAPFTTLIHGDFNADNILFRLGADQVYYVDVHRSGYGDYTQDVSVFLISNFRVPIFSPEIRQRLNVANLRIYACAAEYAAAKDDSTFDARLALGLFRSLVTSTRFVFDKDISSQFIERAAIIMQALNLHKDDLSSFKLNTEWFLYG
jgi:phosphate uptake regulator